MTNALAPVSYKTEKGGEITLAADDIRNFLVKGQGKVTDSEVLIFMNQCKTNQLDPFSNDAWLIKYSDSSPATIILGKDAFIKRADNHPQYDGMDFGIAVVNNNKLQYRKGTMLLPGEVLVGGWCEVYRKDRSHPTRAEVSLAEYNSGKSNWAKMPATMICKVAKSQAQREAFPNQFAGLYDESEISDQVSNQQPEVIEAEVIIETEETPSGPSEMQSLLGQKMREAANIGIKVSGIKSRIESNLGRKIEEFTDAECEKAISIVASLISDKQSLGVVEVVEGDEAGLATTESQRGTAPSLYEEDVPF